MLKWPKLNNSKALREFLGFTGYYRKFIQHYGNIVAPLTNMLLKDSFIWLSVVEEEFEKLKLAMTEALVLLLPDFSKPYIVECDASGNGVGEILLQDHPIAY